MGLFNYVRCRYPLPDPEAQELVFQTKSMLDRSMATYEVTPDGMLVRRSAPQEVDDETESALAPSPLQFVSDKPLPIRGELEIHTSAEQPDGQLRWYSYLLWFRDGCVSDLQRGGDCGQILPLRQTPPSRERPAGPDAGVEV